MNFKADLISFSCLSVYFAFSKIEITYDEQKTAGGGLANAASLIYDFKLIKQG